MRPSRRSPVSTGPEPVTVDRISCVSSGMTQTHDRAEPAGFRRPPRTPHPVSRPTVPGSLPQNRIGAANRLRWRRGTSRRMTARRVVGLARFGVATGLDPELTQLDVMVRASGARQAQRPVDVAARTNGFRARRADALALRASRLTQEAVQLTDTSVVVDPVVGTGTFAELVDRHLENAAVISESVAAGERQHRRVGRGHRIIGRLLPWLDALLFGYFVSGVSNADLSAPWTTPVASLVALALALLVVLIVAAFAPWLGRHLRHDKDVDGELNWPGLGPIATGILLLWVMLLVGMGVTMFVRVQAEAGYAGADSGTGIVVSGLLALAVVVLNVYVLLVAFADGSAETDDLQARSRVIRRHDRRRRRLLRRAAAAIRRRTLVSRRAARTESRALVMAQRRLRCSEQFLDLARLRTGVLRRPEPAGSATDRLNLAALAAAREHIADVLV